MLHDKINKNLLSLVKITRKFRALLKSHSEHTLWRNSIFFFFKFVLAILRPEVALQRGVIKKRHSENVQHIYTRTPMSKCNRTSAILRIEIVLRHGCSPVNLLHIFRIPFYKNTSGGLLLPGQYQIQNSHIIWFLTKTLAMFPKLFGIRTKNGS